MSLVPYLPTLLMLTLKEFFFIPFTFSHELCLFQGTKSILLSDSRLWKWSPFSLSSYLFLGWVLVWLAEMSRRPESGRCMFESYLWLGCCYMSSPLKLCFLDTLQCTLSNKVVFSRQFSLSCFRHMISATFLQKMQLFLVISWHQGYVFTQYVYIEPLNLLFCYSSKCPTNNWCESYRIQTTTTTFWNSPSLESTDLWCLMQIKTCLFMPEIIYIIVLLINCLSWLKIGIKNLWVSVTGL